MQTLSRRLLASLALGGMILLTACADENPEPPNDAPVESASQTLDKLIDDGLANAKSDFQKEVLQRAKESGEISEADWKEANQQYKDCLIARGEKNVEIVYEGSNVLVRSDGEAGNESESEEAQQHRQEEDIKCYEKTSAFINEIYSYLAGDQPDEGEHLRVIFDCIIENELAPKDTTFDEFEADLEQNDGKQYGMSDDPDKTGITKCWTDNL